MRAGFFIFIVACFLVPASAFAQTAAELNKRGYALYEQKKYDEALPYFEAAAAKDNRYHFARYNYACAAALLLARNYCEYQHLIEPLFVYLEEAVKLNQGYKEKMFADPDLKAVRDTYRFYRLAGLDPQSPADFRRILTGLTWYGPNPGIFPASPVVKFMPDGRLEVRHFTAAGEGDPGYVTFSGFFTIEKGARGPVLRLTVDERDGRLKTFEAEFRDGVIVFPRGELPELSDQPEQCGA